MFSIWFTGFLLFLAYRIFNAGRTPHTLFYRDPRSYEGSKQVFDENLVWAYAAVSLVFGIFWMAALPVIGIYLLGKRFAKES